MSNKIVFSQHALSRMFEREISPEFVKNGIIKGSVITEYPDDTPYPSRLILFMDGERIIHIVIAHDYENDITFVITVYEPDPLLWDETFTKRRNL